MPPAAGGRKAEMMPDQFREIEAAFGRLKEKFSEGKISQREFIASLKKLRIRDDEGRFWMIGAQSGKWYFFDGNDWAQAKPPSFSERKAICIYCGYENDLEAETCVRCGSQRASTTEARVCPKCGTKLEDPAVPCPVCEAEAGGGPAAAAQSREPIQTALERSLVVRALQPASFFWFFGILGVFAGMILGLVIGVTSLFPGVVSSLPGIFADIQGKLLGGIVFTIAGGLFGFVAAGAAGFLAAAASNGILSLIGGVRIHAAWTSGPPDDNSQP
jgi:ribosomal protein L40E